MVITLNRGSVTPTNVLSQVTKQQLMYKGEKHGLGWMVWVGTLVVA